MLRRLGHWARRRAARGLVLGVGIAALACLALVAVGGAPPSVAAHQRDTPTINIQIPTPDSNGVAQGPVGANLTLTGSGFTDGHSYQLGYVPQGQQCGTNGTSFPNGTVTSSGGAMSATVQWPSGASNVGGEYALCALDTTDTTQPPVQSTDLFRVVAANAPTFTLQDPSTSSALQGPPYLLYLGASVTIAGHNFAPGGLTLVAYLSKHKIASGSDLDSATALSTANSTAITTQDSGDVKATVQLPTALDTGSYYLYLVSSDRQGASLPSLMAFVQASVTQQPTPTPKPSPTATPKVSPTPNTSNSSGGTDAGRIFGVVGLSLLSLALLIAGVLLLAGGPRRLP